MSLSRRLRRRKPANSPSLTEPLETRCLLSRITVTSAADNMTEDGEVTLREAIHAANSNRSVDGSAAGQYRTADVIEFAESLAGQTITLSEGHLRVRSDVTIEGGGITIDGGRTSRHFSVSGNNVDFTISDMTLSNGAAASGGSIANIGSRGGRLSITDVIFEGNQSNNEGGAIHLKTLEGLYGVPYEFNVSSSTFRDNDATGSGGAIYAYGFADTAIADSTFTSNTSDARGGAILIGDSDDNSHQMSLNITGSTFTDNQATDDGGAAAVSATGSTRIRNSVFTNNSSDAEGGALRLDQTPSPILSGVQFEFNTAQSNGGAISADGYLAVADASLLSNQAAGNGGAISARDLNLIDSEVRDNSADFGGGLTTTYLHLLHSRILGNSATKDGGGVLANFAAIQDTQLRQNTAAETGGAVAASRALWMHRSSVVGNTADYGGGVSVEFASSGNSDSTITNSTFSENEAHLRGGGVYVRFGRSQANTFEIHQSTISNNTLTGDQDPRGGGVYTTSNRFGGRRTVRVSSSIIAGNETTGIRDDYHSDETVEETFTHSLIGNNRGSGLNTTDGTPDENGNLVGSLSEPLDAGLLPLASFGGDFFSHALRADSPALDLGENLVEADHDMIGRARQAGDAIDMGALERHGDSPTALVRVGDVSIVEGSDGGTSIARVTFSLDGAADGVVTASFATLDGSARAADGDYVAKDGTIELSGENGSTATVDFEVTADTDLEFDESFFVRVTEVTGAGIPLSDAQGEVLIEEDETIGIGLTNGTVLIRTSETANTLTASEFEGQFRVNLDGMDHDFDLRAIDRVLAILGDGADSFDASTSPLSVEVYGNEGDDTLIGSDFNDTLGGGEGTDDINGMNGQDSILGGRGNDTLLGGEGYDTILGGYDDDLIEGQDGFDELFGDAGNDTIKGGGGRDEIEGGEGNDEMSGGSDHDRLEGNDGDDTLAGGSGNDTILGNAGDDSTLGGSGVDRLEGGEGNDTIRGGLFSDYINGNAGDDILVGDAGSDRIYGGAGNDVIAGKEGDDNLFGETGDDTLAGHGGDDSLHGHEGSDSLRGHEGNDELFGGTENDVLIGDAGIDLLYGDAGSDRLVGGEGQDLLIGGTTTARLSWVYWEWIDPNKSYNQRVVNIVGASGKTSNRRNSNEYLRGSNHSSPTTVDDNQTDTLNGGDGLDLFFGNKTATNKDRIFRDADEKFIKI